MFKNARKSVLSMLLAMIMVLPPFTGIMPVTAAAATEQSSNYIITNPYENVNWVAYSQYKADFHAHSTNSDGANTVTQMVEDHYAKGFDIFTMTDHSVLTSNWDKVPGGVTSERKAEIEAGDGRDGRGMIDIDNCNEQSATDHINSFFAAYNDVVGGTNTMAGTIAAVQALGGITHINHPGRYTGGAVGGDAGAAASNNPVNVNKYVSLFMTYPSLVGMEIVNKDDNESRSDKILWDNILKQTMPEGRLVWGFANDDTHSLGATGFAWNVMLMPELTQFATRNAMENGEFYTVSRIDRRENINAMNLSLTTPSITDIVVENDTITIIGADYDTVEWIADGVKIATGATLDLNDYDHQINSYVRAQLKSSYGIAYTQPFGVKSVNQPPIVEGVNTAEGLFSAIAVGKNVITLTGDIILTGNTILTINSDVTIQSAEGEQYTVLFMDGTGVNVQNPGKLTLTNVNFILDSASTRGYFIYLNGANGPVEVRVYGCHIESQKPLTGSTGLFYSSGANTTYIENSTIVSISRTFYEAAVTQVVYLVNSTVANIGPDPSLYRGYFILMGTTTYNTASGFVYDFRNATITGPSESGDTVELKKSGTGASVNNAAYKIYYSFNPNDFATGSVTEYIGPVVISEDATIYAAIGYTQNGKTLFHTPVAFDCVYEDKGGEPPVAPFDVNFLILSPGSDETQLNFSWHSTYPVSNPVVRIWKEGGTAVEITGVSSVAVNAISVMYYNRITITGLEAGVTYQYQLGNGNGSWSEEYTTKTAGNPVAFSYLVFGDPQTGGQVNGDVWKNTLELALGMYPDLAFMASTGDNIDTPTKEQFSYFFTPKDIFSFLPLAVCQGNHDGVGMDTQTFYYPPNADGTQNYWYRYGDTLFIVHNGGSLDTLLKNAIDANPNAIWRILNFHYDVYGQAGHALSDAKASRDVMVPIIDKYDIDVVFNGHDHSYSRSYPMKWSGSAATSNDEGMQPETFGLGGESINPTGTVYFTLNSASGQKYYDLIAKQAYTAFMHQEYRPMFSVVEITSDSFTCTTYQVNVNNTVTMIDSYTILKIDEYVSRTVSFDTDGGSEVDPVTVRNGGKIVKPADPAKEDCVFNCWLWNGVEFDFNTPITADITLTATWYVSYTVSYDTAGGNSVAPAKVGEGMKAVRPTDPTKAGYLFNSWLWNGVEFDFNTPITADITLTATWDESRTVSFDTDGGSSIPPVYVKVGEKLVKPVNPTKASFIFNRWLWNGEEFDFQTPITTDITLTATWDGVPLKAESVFNNGNPMLTDCWEAGGTWGAAERGVVEGSSVYFDHDRRYTPCYPLLELEPNKIYNIRVLAKSATAGSPWDGSTGNKICFQYRSASEEAAGASDWDKYVMYITEGEWAWYEGTITTPFDLTGTLNGVCTVTIQNNYSALWVQQILVYETLPSYIVEFVDFDGRVLAEESVEYGSAATAPADPLREGYTFIGWDKDFAHITGNLTVNAQYKINESKPTLVSLTATPSSTNLQNNTTVTITITGYYSDGSSVKLASTAVKLKQNGTQTVKVGEYEVTVVVNGNNKITDCYVGKTGNGSGSQDGNSQGGNSQGGNSQGSGSKGNQQ